MAQKPLSLRAYASHRKAKGLPGGSLQAVQRAVQAGRVTVVTVDGARRIQEPEAADREWAANTDRSRAPGYVKDCADAEDLDGDDAVEHSSLSTAAAREKHWKAEMAELTYRQRAGELVDASEVETEYAEFCSTVRTKVLNIPNRLKQAHADLTLAHLATLDELLREALSELAGDEDTEAAGC